MLNERFSNVRISKQKHSLHLSNFSTPVYTAGSLKLKIKLMSSTFSLIRVQNRKNSYAKPIIPATFYSHFDYPLSPYEYYSFFFNQNLMKIQSRITEKFKTNYLPPAAIYVNFQSF